MALTEFQKQICRLIAANRETVEGGYLAGGAALNELIEAGRPAESSFEVLDAATRKLERLQLQLRTRDGVPLDALDPSDVAEMGELVRLVESSTNDDRLVLTRAGRLLANEVSLRLRV